KQREIFYGDIRKNASAYCVATASIREIEELNILGAAMLAMKRAVEGLKITPKYVLVDGNRMPDIAIPGETLVKADGISAAVSSASILAKVERDRYMVEMSKKYPEYGFEKHKGYGTAAHYEALKKHGKCEIHRDSFLKKLTLKG
ncbi:MAG: ribonuclease HII, partial [Oscillospiraceae bacterium]|nr:ribonuclease HII [Oscillospiraceae bacterium]